MNNSIKAYRVLLNIKQTDMAKKLGMCLTSYNQKEQGKKEFTYSEMRNILVILREQIPELTADEIFFANKVIIMKTNAI